MYDSFEHIPVMYKEVIELLNPREGGLYVDGTTGGGGHSRLILEADTKGHLYCLDRDQRALDKASKYLADYHERIEFIHTDFRNIENLPQELMFDGVLMDLGVSSFQLDDPNAGFSFRHDGELDMRMDRSQGMTASEFISHTGEKELADIIRKYGEERFAGRIARVIKERDAERPFASTLELAEVIKKVYPKKKMGKIKIDPATRTFQALRIAVNDELSGLDNCFKRYAQRLKPGGRLAVISFHSLEDRIVKWAFRELTGRVENKQPRNLPFQAQGPEAEFELVNRKPVTATEEELEKNPRSRSAKLRVLARKEDNS
jgi:16S rRNA (cytosine1402-N4)-methyltransferase